MVAVLTFVLGGDLVIGLLPPLFGRDIFTWVHVACGFRQIWRFSDAKMPQGPLKIG